MTATILVVEDAPIVRDLVVRYLQREGFDTLAASDGEEALRLLPKADLVVLDVMLPKIDGLEVCRRIRVAGDQPIIMVTAKGRIRDKLVGLALGADDYLVKPFSAAELVARVNVILRRTVGHWKDDDIVQVGDLVLNGRSRVVIRGERVLDLSDREFDLLLFLARHAGQAFTRRHLLEHVWDDAITERDHVVTVCINRLRQKIEPYPARPSYLKTAWGIGYTLVA